jgi:hypothetical protein
MNERVEACRANVRVTGKVPSAVEQGVWAEPVPCTMTDVVEDRIKIRPGAFGSLEEVPTTVK